MAFLRNRPGLEFNVSKFSPIGPKEKGINGGLITNAEREGAARSMWELMEKGNKDKRVEDKVIKEEEEKGRKEGRYLARILEFRQSSAPLLIILYNQSSLRV